MTQESTAREVRARAREKPLLTYEQARANRLQIDWDDHVIASPWFLGRRYLDDVPLAEIAQYIDWTFFFSAWELKGRFPAILDHPQYGAGGARALRERAGAAEADHRRAAAARRAASTASGRPTATATTSSSTRTTRAAEELARLPMLRQQEVIADGRPNRSLADFIAPRESGVPDYLGMFAVTAGHRRRRAGAAVRAGARRLQRDHGQGAGRSAGRGVRRVPARPGAQGLGLRRDEKLTAEELSPRSTAASGRRTAIRPARITARSSSCSRSSTHRAPGHHADRHARDAPGGERQRAVFPHPEAKVLQRRPHRPRSGRSPTRSARGMPLEEVERWLAPNLAYDPVDRRSAPAWIASVRAGAGPQAAGAVGRALGTAVLEVCA